LTIECPHPAPCTPNRLTCSVLKHGTLRYKKAAVQVSTVGGYTAVHGSDGDDGSGEGGDGATLGLGGSKGKGEAEGEGEGGLVDVDRAPPHSQSTHSRDGTRILGKLPHEYLDLGPDLGALTPPEEHFDTTCDNEQKMACYRLKQPP
jgi:hypothetical protein